MFGKPEWFVERTKGWGIRPTTWQGWSYLGAWTAVIAAPAVVMLARSQFLETLVWSAVAGGVLMLDVRSVVRQLRQSKERDELFYIGEEADSHVATQKYDLEVRHDSRVT